MGFIAPASIISARKYSAATQPGEPDRQCGEPGVCCPITGGAVSHKRTRKTQAKKGMGAPADCLSSPSCGKRSQGRLQKRSPAVEKASGRYNPVGGLLEATEAVGRVGSHTPRGPRGTPLLPRWGGGGCTWGTQSSFSALHAPARCGIPPQRVGIRQPVAVVDSALRRTETQRTGASTVPLRPCSINFWTPRQQQLGVHRLGEEKRCGHLLPVAVDALSLWIGLKGQSWG